MNFTTEQVCTAVGLVPNTLRKWSNPNTDPKRDHERPGVLLWPNPAALMLDAEQGRSGKWRRYSIADCARIFLVKMLAVDVSANSDRAIRVVNSLFDSATVGKGPWILFPLLDVAHRRSFASLEELQLYATAHGFPPASVLVSMETLIRRTLVALSRYDVRRLGER
jgi:hypothetical protein